MTTFADVLARPAARRPRPPPGHVLRRRDRRAHRAVGDDVRQLGRQDRLAARRGARPRARADGCASTCPRTGSARSSSAPRGRSGLVVTADDDAGRRRVRARTASTAGRARADDLPVLACCAAAAGRAVRRRRCRPASTTSGSRSGRSPTRSRAWDPPGPTTTSRCRASPRPSCGERPPPGVSSPTAAASSRRRTRLPHRVSPPSPSRSHAAARWSWSPTPTRSGSRRRTPPSAPRPASLERTSVPVSRPGRSPPSPRRGTGAAEARRPCPGAATGSRSPSRARSGRGARSGSTSLTPTTQSYGVRSSSSACGLVSPPGPLPGKSVSCEPLRNRLSGAPSVSQRPTATWRPASIAPWAT